MDFHTSPSTHARYIDESTAEGQIRQLIENVAEAIEEGDVNRILSAYASDAVIYDARDALEIDKAGFRKNWEECFQMTQNFRSEIGEITVIANENLAFSHCLMHSTGIDLKGNKIDNWVRVTDCYCRINGDWKVVHEHVSMPGDFVSGKVLLNIKPNQNFGRQST